MIQILSLLLYSISILLSDFKSGVMIRLDISTTFAIMIFLTSISHLAALSPIFDIGKSWATYLVPQYLERGLFVFSLGSVIIMEALRRAIGKPVVFEFSQQRQGLFNVVLAIGVIVFILNHFRVLPLLGTISSFVGLLVNGSVFFLAFNAHSSISNFRVYLVVLFTTALSLYAIQFSYLRMEIITPWLAYFLGELLARRQIVRLHLVSKLVFFVGLIVFPVIFTYLGKNRSTLSGQKEKLEKVLKEGTRLDKTDDGETLLGRLNVLGQMSNVVNLTERKGFYNGYTLSYLSFVFIPRILWPDKPKLDGGQWFAVEIGRSYYLPNGRASNSVNMTVPGEMYLNFGFIGLVIGCILFGFFIGFIWNSVYGTDLLSWTFRFYLLFLGMFSLGSDMMVIPQLMAYWLIYKTVTFFRTRLYA